MKFSLQQMMLFVTLAAILLCLFSGSHNHKSIGRHVLFAVMVILGATRFAYWHRGWLPIQVRSAIGGLSAAVLYGVFVWLFLGALVEIPPFIRMTTTVPELTRHMIFLRECAWQVPLSLFLGSTIAPLLILLRLDVELDETNQTNRNISTVLLGLVLLIWLLAVIDGWNRNYLESHWMPILGGVLLLFMLFTFSWIGDVFKSLDGWKANQYKPEHAGE